VVAIAKKQWARAGALRGGLALEGLLARFAGWPMMQSLSSLRERAQPTHQQLLRRCPGPPPPPPPSTSLPPTRSPNKHTRVVTPSHEHTIAGTSPERACLAH
jgi:hypothetical protein